MKRTFTLLAAAATLTIAGAAHALTAHEAVSIINANGYYAPHDLELTAGAVWRANATAPNGTRLSVLVDNATGALTAIDRAAMRSGQLPGAAQVMQTLKNAGWAIVQELDFDDGLWEAEVRQGRGQPKVEVYVHPVTLAILDPAGTPASGGTAASVLSAQEIVAALQGAGYRNIHDVEFDDDGYWEAEATNASGQCVDLYINPTTGAVLREQLDRDDWGCTGSNTGTNTGGGSATQPAGRLTAAQITQRLTQLGYTRIHDLEYERAGYWEAEARNARGQKVDLYINATTGAVIRETIDRD